MLCRTSTIRHTNSGVSMTTPLLIPSFSSKGFARSKKNGKSEIGKIFVTAREFLTEVVLISAYDIFYEHLPHPSDLSCMPEMTFVDSGGYEISTDRDYSSVIDPFLYPEQWSTTNLECVYDNWPGRCCVIRARGEPGREAHPPQHTRSDRGIPSSAIRFSTAHLIAASTFWFLTVRAERLAPSIALYRETAFSATLWRVQPLDFRHS